MKIYIDSVGTGDVGNHVELKDGKELKHFEAIPIIY